MCSPQLVTLFAEAVSSTYTKVLSIKYASISGFVARSGGERSAEWHAIYLEVALLLVAKRATAMILVSKKIQKNVNLRWSTDELCIEA
jgi:hypothetical protein